MKINNLDCCKPKRRLSFSSENRTGGASNKKVLYKHYSELSREDLYKRSVIKASQKAQNSGKMRIFKALPKIGAAIIGTSLALTQPGKTTSKIAAGLGFLMFEKGLDDIYKGSSKAYEQADAKTKSKLGKESIAKGFLFALTGATMLMGGAAAAKGGKNILSKLSTSKAGDVFSKEIQNLKDEINKSKIAQKLENIVDPFFKKHKTLSFFTPLLTAMGVSAGVSAAQMKLSQGINDTFKKDVYSNYAHARANQQKIKANYDKVEAKEF